MKKVGFIGAFEKTDLIVYTAKILTQIGKKVLIIDATALQKGRYIVPAVAPTKNYVTTYEDIDIAVGYRDLPSVYDYLGNIENTYDLVLIDIDHPSMFKSFNMEDASKLYFVTAFDNFSLMRGMEIVKNINQSLQMTKIFFEREIHDEYEEYLNLLSYSYPIEWNEKRIFFPYDQGDLSAIIENQRVSKINLRNLSDQYRKSLLLLAQDIEPEFDFSGMKRIIKKL